MSRSLNFRLDIEYILLAVVGTEVTAEFIIERHADQLRHRILGGLVQGFFSSTVIVAACDESSTTNPGGTWPLHSSHPHHATGCTTRPQNRKSWTVSWKLWRPAK